MKKQEKVLEADRLKKVFRRGSEEIIAVNDVSLQITRGEFISITGPSGSGKTTLINILGCLDNATSGSLILNGETVFTGDKALSERELTRIRRQVFGYIFQKFYLIPTLTVMENVMLPFAFYKKGTAAESPRELVEFLGLEKRLQHRPGQLSGGEMQRVAIARALANKPEILLADEPTGNLDTRRSHEIGEILRSLNEKEKLTILLVTHNMTLAKLAHRTIELQDGKIKNSK